MSKKYITVARRWDTIPCGAPVYMQEDHAKTGQWHSIAYVTEDGAIRFADYMEFSPAELRMIAEKVAGWRKDKERRVHYVRVKEPMEIEAFVGETYKIGTDEVLEVRMAYDDCETMLVVYKGRCVAVDSNAVVYCNADGEIPRMTVPVTSVEPDTDEEGGDDV